MMMSISSWVILSIFLILHMCAGVLLPWQPGFKLPFPLLMEKAAAELKRRLLNRPKLPVSDQQLRGFFALAAIALCALIIGGAVQRINYGLLNLILLALSVNFMTTAKVLREVAQHLGKEPQKAMEALQPYVKEPLAGADVHAVMRKSIEYMAFSMLHSFIGPAFWFGAMGPLGLTMYVSFNALYQAVGASESEQKNFGKYIQMADMVMNVIPAAITAFILAVSLLFIPDQNPQRIYTTVKRRIKTDYFPYSDWPLAIIAGGLGITLMGSKEFGYKYRWIGPKESSAQISSDNFSRSMLLQYIFFICAFILVSGISFLKV